MRAWRTPRAGETLARHRKLPCVRSGESSSTCAYMNKRLLVGAAVSLTLAAGASADILITKESYDNGTNSIQNPYTALTDDLINGLTPTGITGTFNLEGTGGIPVLTDGLNPATMSRDDVPPGEPTGFQ